MITNCFFSACVLLGFSAGSITAASDGSSAVPSFRKLIVDSLEGKILEARVELKDPPKSEYVRFKVFNINKKGPSIEAALLYGDWRGEKVWIVSSLKVVQFSQLPQILSSSTIEDFQKLVDPDVYDFQFLPATGGFIVHLNWITVSPKNKLLIVLQTLEIDASPYPGVKAKIQIIKTLFDEIPLS